jgi:hypothetical protein
LPTRGNEFVGDMVGIMDQFAACFGTPVTPYSSTAARWNFSDCSCLRAMRWSSAIQNAGAGVTEVSVSA